MTVFKDLIKKMKTDTNDSKSAGHLLYFTNYCTSRLMKSFFKKKYIYISNNKKFNTRDKIGCFNRVSMRKYFRAHLFPYHFSRI